MEPIDYSVGVTTDAPPSPSAPPRVGASIIVPSDLHLTPASVDNRTPRKKSSRRPRRPLNDGGVILGNTAPSKAQVQRLQNEVWLLKKKLKCERQKYNEALAAIQEDLRATKKTYRAKLRTESKRQSIGFLRKLRGEINSLVIAWKDEAKAQAERAEHVKKLQNALNERLFEVEAEKESRRERRVAKESEARTELDLTIQDIQAEHERLKQQLHAQTLKYDANKAVMVETHRREIQGLVDFHKLQRGEDQKYYRRLLDDVRDRDPVFGSPSLSNSFRIERAVDTSPHKLLVEEESIIDQLEAEHAAERAVFQNTIHTLSEELVHQEQRLKKEYEGRLFNQKQEECERYAMQCEDLLGKWLHSVALDVPNEMASPGSLVYSVKEAVKNAETALQRSNEFLAIASMEESSFEGATPQKKKKKKKKKNKKT